MPISHQNITSRDKNQGKPAKLKSHKGGLGKNYGKRTKLKPRKGSLDKKERKKKEEKKKI